MANVAKQKNIAVEVVVESGKQDGSLLSGGSGCSNVLIKSITIHSRIGTLSEIR
jgi:hypothetical protein